MAQLPKLHTLLRAHRWRLSGGNSGIESDETPASDRRSYRSQRAARWPDVADRQCLGQPAVVAFMRLRASLGIEGGFTQAAGAVGSKVGRLLKRRRHDVRMLVGAGAAGGIAGAFGAPFAGAAYGLELMVGSYTVATLPPVVAAAVAGTLAAHTFVGHTYHVHLDKLNLAQQGHLTGVALGIACGLLSVVLMRGVTATERLFHRSGLRLALRPVSAARDVRAVTADAVPLSAGSTSTFASPAFK